MTHADLPAFPVSLASLTVAAVRRIAITLQCAATIAAGWVAHGWAGWHRSAATLLTDAALMLDYLISAGWAFLVSLKSLNTVIPDDPMQDRMSVPCKQRIGITGFITYWLRECVSVAWMFNVLQPFHARATFSASAGTGRRVPVLMVHGCGCNHMVWLSIQQHLVATGHPADAIDLMPLLGNTDECTQDIAAAVAQLTRAHGRAPILLCRNVGELTARALLRQAKPSPVTHVITFGTPHRGTTMARTGRGHSVCQMTWASPWPRQLATSETLAVRVRITSIFS